jgi:hypothetical protein
MNLIISEPKTLLVPKRERILIPDVSKLLVPVRDFWETLEFYPLTPKIGPLRNGVYMIYWKRKQTYAGRSLGQKSNKIQGRLDNHVDKLKDRENISLSEMECRFFPLDDERWIPVWEEALIAYYQPTWNGSGFGYICDGGKDTYHNRTTPTQFSVMFPLKTRRIARLEI